MLTESPAVASPRKPRRPVAKSTRTQGEKATKTAVYLSSDSMRRLGVTSLMEGRTQSEIVDQLIREHLRRYVVQVRDRAASEVCDDTALPTVSDAA